MLSSLFSEYYR